MMFPKKVSFGLAYHGSIWMGAASITDFLQYLHSAENTTCAKHLYRSSTLGSVQSVWFILKEMRDQ